jgi:hypothetical protein
MPRTPKKKYPCPDCGEPFKSWQARWIHRRDQHGAVPKKPGQWKPKRSEQNGAIIPQTHDHPHSHETHQDSIPRVQADIENAINYTAGRCQQLIEDFAVRIGVPATLITSGVADVLHAQASGQTHRADHRLSFLRD